MHINLCFLILQVSLRKKGPAGGANQKAFLRGSRSPCRREAVANVYMFWKWYKCQEDKATQWKAQGAFL